MEDEWLERMESWDTPSDDARSAFDVDCGRVIHSGSFRRLQGKTQILNLGDSDFYRTRLTHSLEVAQLAGSIVRQIARDHREHPAIPFLAPENLVRTLGFAHDLGHAPFGHGGEIALNYCMRNAGGFEGNGHTLRIISRLESFSATCGSNLSRRTVLGVVKYPVPLSALANPDITPRMIEGTTVNNILDRQASKPPKCFLDTETDVVDWALAPFSNRDRETLTTVEHREGKHGRTLHKTFDCSVMEAADDIAYGVHDLEDAIALGLVSREQFRAHVAEDQYSPLLSWLKERYSKESGNDVFSWFVERLFDASPVRKHTINRLVGYFIRNGLAIETHDEFDHGLLKYRVKLQDGPRRVLDALQKVVSDIVIKGAHVQHLEFKGQQMVIAVSEALSSDPRSFLPLDAKTQWESAKEDPRIICDYVAGMTDGFLLKTYDRLFSPRMGSVFDKL